VAELWPQAVVFDLDGTLIDSAGDIADALNAALERSRLAPFSEAEVRLMVGGGARVLIERALAVRDADAELAERLHADFLEVYRTAAVSRTVIYEHGQQLLAELGELGIKRAICTNKPQGITEDVLGKLGLRSHFEAVIGASDSLPKKPDPAMLRAALGALGVAPRGAVMIGDSGADVVAAHAANVPVIAVSFGYTRVPPQDLGADLVIDSLADALPAIRHLTIRRAD